MYALYVVVKEVPRRLALATMVAGDCQYQSGKIRVAILIIIKRFALNTMRQKPVRRRRLTMGNVDKVAARRRAVILWRHHYLNAGEKARERAMAECDKNIKAAYTKWYKDFWTEVKRNLEHGAP